MDNEVTMTESDDDLMDWYDGLVSARYLDIGSGRFAGYKVESLSSGKSLVIPATVYGYSNTVIARHDDITDENSYDLLYDVRTKRVGLNAYELIGKHFYSIKVFKHSGTLNSMGYKFLVVKNSSRQIHEMLKNRANWSKHNSIVPPTYTNTKK